MNLREWQKPHANALLESLRVRGVALDASDTGTGKTYIAAWVAKEYGHHTFVVCPKAVQPKWRAVLADAGISPVEVMNVEKLKRSKYLVKRGNTWTWMLSIGTLVIFDEAHNFGGINTGNAQIMYATRAAKLPVLALSATIAYSPLRFRALGYLLGLFESWFAFWNWSLSHGAAKEWIFRGDRGRISVIQFDPHSAIGKAGVEKIHQEVFQAGKGRRLRSAETPGFPVNHVYVETITFDAQPELLKAYRDVKKTLEANEPHAIKVTKIIRMREAVEILKANDLVSMVNDLQEEYAVVVFVNFLESMWKLHGLLLALKPALIYGDQTVDEREAERLRFVTNETRVCICTFGAGGVGLDLHDLHGVPRISLINPTWSAVQFKQALGRIHREDAKSPAIQRLLYASGTLEEDVAKRVEANINNLSLLQDGDLEFK